MCLNDVRPNLAWALRKRLVSAHQVFVDQEEAFNALTNSIDADLITKWTEVIEAWEQDMSLDDPYQVVHTGRSFVLPYMGILR